MVNKKGFSYLNFWVEAYAILGFVIGFIFAITMRNVYVLYAITFLCGFILARILFLMKTEPTFPFYLMMFTTFIGFVLGGWISKNTFSLKIMTLVFLGSIYIGYKLHSKGYL